VCDFRFSRLWQCNSDEVVMIMSVCWDIFPCKMGCGYQLLGAVGTGVARVGEKWSRHNSVQLNIMLYSFNNLETSYEQEDLLQKKMTEKYMKLSDA